MSKYIKKGWNPKSAFKKGKQHWRSSGMKGKKLSEESKRKMRESRIKYLTSHKGRFKDTNIEQKIEAELKRRNIYYEKQVPLCKVTVVDFYLPQTRAVIYCNGLYWHSKPEDKQRDINQDLILMFHGFNVYRLPGAEINKSAKKCINKILKRR